MSLDVWLEKPAPQRTGSGVFVLDAGRRREISKAEWGEKFPGLVPDIPEESEEPLFQANITHNLGRMADAAGIYRHLWRPEEVGVKTASDLVGPLSEGLGRLKANPEAYEALNPKNGWGDYEGLVRFVEDYLDACRESPEALVFAHR